jgi:hypothetical protein
MADASVPALPGELLRSVLHRVDVQQRVGSCSLVCRAWRAAAGAVTTEVVVKSDKESPHHLSSRQRIYSLGQWLCAHAAAVDHLTVQGDSEGPFNAGGTPLLQLPVSQVRQLQLLSVDGCDLQALPEGGSSGNMLCSTNSSSSSTRATTVLAAVFSHHCLA